MSEKVHWVWWYEPGDENKDIEKSNSHICKQDDWFYENNLESVAEEIVEEIVNESGTDDAEEMTIAILSPDRFKGIWCVSFDYEITFHGSKVEPKDGA